MSSAVDSYRVILRKTKDWEAYLKKESRLPGPRGNLELAHAAAREGTKGFFTRAAALDADRAPENTPEVFLAFCGVLGLGRLLAEGEEPQEPVLRRLARDSRWRIREAVATGLQIVGDASPSRLHRIARTWLRLGWLEQRAAVAAVAEPRLLVAKASAVSALRLLDRATRNLARGGAGSESDRRVLRQALGYAWSVVAAAAPKQGQVAMEAWFASEDEDVRWVMRENLGKARLRKLDPKWCAAWEKRLRPARRTRSKR
jgi:hypothetical protein